MAFVSLLTVDQQVHCCEVKFSRIWLVNQPPESMEDADRILAVPLLSHRLLLDQVLRGDELDLADLAVSAGVPCLLPRFHFGDEGQCLLDHIVCNPHVAALGIVHETVLDIGGIQCCRHVSRLLNRHRTVIV